MILTYAQDKVGADLVEHLLRSASETGTNAYMSEINLEQVRQLPIQVVFPTTGLILRASEVKAEYADLLCRLFFR